MNPLPTVVGMGTGCSTGDAAQPWLGPVAFSKIIIGLEHYQDDAPAQQPGWMIW